MIDQKIAEYLLNLLEAGAGTVAKADVADKLPFLDDADIVRIFAEYAPDVRETTVAGIPCWQHIELPANFAEHLNEAAANLERLGFPLSPDNMNLALSLRYDKNFRRDYGLEDRVEFTKVLKRFSVEIDQNRRNGSESGSLRSPKQPLPRSLDRRYGSESGSLQELSSTVSDIDFILEEIWPIGKGIYTSL